MRHTEPAANGPTVLYIGGFGRSGSTLLERVLGQVPGAVAVGELVHLIERGLIDNQDCGCGLPFDGCPFWTDVGAKAFGGWDRVTGLDWLQLKQRVDRNRFIPLMMAPLLPGYRRALAQYAERMSLLYTAIAEVSGADLIIDSSKHASTAFLLRRVHGIRLRVLHLVRDSRGVAYSWTKEITRPEIRERVALMPQFHPASAAAHWLGYNTLFELLRVIRTPLTFVRYEDFLAAPVTETMRAVTEAGSTIHSADLAFLDGRHVDLQTDHSVAGNPMRFTTGRIELRSDEAWHQKLSRSHRWIVTILTAPLLARYHYLRRRW
jgi:Sulfotransferase family